MTPVRVQIPAYTDRWMMGDRYGEIVKIRPKAYRAKRPDLPLTAFLRDTTVEIAHVRLDKSGKTVRVILADCEVLS